MLIVLICSAWSQYPVMVSGDSDVEKEIDKLMSKMSLEEKVGQMTNISLMALAKGDFWMKRDTVILDREKMKNLLGEKYVGSVQNLGSYPFSPEEWKLQIAQLQEFISENTPNKIPVLYGIDAVHGANYSAGSTLFPHELSIAATRNPEMAYQTGKITSYELGACDIPWNYAPVLDVSKQPVWGRIFETFGEDTYIASVMGRAFIEGSQGEDLADPYTTAVCLKHFIGYGTPFNGKDRSPAYIPENYLREIYLPPFKAAIEAGALTVMINSGSVNGVPSHADYKMITNVLKGELGFEGFTISDWEDVVNLYKIHRVATDEREAVKIAINAGLDMCMEPYDASFADHLIDLVQGGEVKQERVDDAVRRILRVKMKLGLFDKKRSKADYSEYGSDRHTEASYRAAVESICMVKNKDHLLPLSKEKKYLVTGVAANSLNYLNGAWSRTWSGRETEFNDKGKLTILDAISKITGEQNIVYAEGTSHDSDVDISLAVERARDVDGIIVCAGEIPATEKPSDINDLDLPEAQLSLIHKLSETGKPIVLVLVEARPRIIRSVEPKCSSILVSFLPGNEGGRAIANILFGIENPSGKLPLTYPKYSNSIWTYDHTRADERDAGFGFDGFQPQYEFGHGLSYTDFEFSQLELNKPSYSFEDSIQISLNVKNIGNRIGKEVIEIYSTDLVASITPAVKRLRRFKKIELEAGERQNVSFSIHPSELSFVNRENERILEPGQFLITADTLTQKFFLNE